MPTLTSVGLLLSAAPALAMQAASTALYPAVTQFASQPVFAWTKSTGATFYKLYVNGPSGFLYETPWITAAAAGSCNVTIVFTCEYTPMQPALKPGAHTWWVLAWGPTNGASPWSAAKTFNQEDTTTLYPPGADSGADHSSQNTGGIRDENSALNLQWDQGSGASWYNVYVQDDTGVRYNQWHTAASICSAICSVTPALASPYSGTGEVTWWVQPYKDDATYGAGGYGNWSQPDWFQYRTTAQPKVNPGPVIQSPNGFLIFGSGSHTFTWTQPNPGPPVDEYWLSVGTSRGATDIRDGSVGTNTSQLVTGMPPSAHAHVRLWFRRGAVWRFDDWRWLVNARPAADEVAPPIAMPGGTAGDEVTPAPAPPANDIAPPPGSGV